jgi:hypothetical protein
MDMLVRWLTGDYVETNVEPYAVQRMPPVIR